MKRLLILTAALLLPAGVAMAEVDVQALVDNLHAKGFTSVEVKTTPTEVKVEAVKNNKKVEVTYDRATGDVLKREQSRSTNTSTGGDDDGIEDEHGNDDGTGHDAGDDHGEDGSGHDAGDDHGGDDHGGDSGGESGHSGSNSGSGGGDD